MSIQVSVVIWTVICFVLMMLILSKLLFKPVLEVMDKRKEHIESARLKKLQREELASQYALQALENQRSRVESRKKAIRQELEQVRVQSKTAIETANKKRLSDVEQYIVSSEEELQQTVASLSEKTSAIAVAFANKIVSQ